MVVPAGDVEPVMRACEQAGERAFHVGEIVAGPDPKAPSRVEFAGA
jgi:hypothetical protein